MSNKNQVLIMAFFPSADKADNAAEQLKDWEHTHKDIKLGGMGIITYYNGKLHTRKIGARATATGVKWGTLLGATGGLLAGIATGGAGLIPGAIVGLGAGGATGSLIHKKLGMSDAHKARLEDHLKAGGAAIGVMADDFEVEDTKAELFALGGDVDHYDVPEESAEALHDAAHAVEESEQDTDYQPLAAVPAAAVVQKDANDSADLEIQVAAMMATVRGMDEAAAARLQAAGVHNAQDLLEKASTPKRRKDLADKSGISRQRILNWANQLDLERVSGIGSQYAELLAEAGVESVPELALRNPANLQAKLTEVNRELLFVDSLPYEEEIAAWIAQAKELPRVITY